MTETVPQPAEGLRQHLAEAMAKEAGQVVSRLQQAVRTLPDPQRAASLDGRVKAVLSPYR
ncbi:hypothetical protein ACGFU4_35845 [Streptomyces sp. NPDC048511]|uniref:hypothetical protein n=1 Tax=Streptomyces sp. NPDC048511 TaxID=3365562 RepID=UPI0037224606